MGSSGSYSANAQSRIEFRQNKSEQNSPEEIEKVLRLDLQKRQEMSEDNENYDEDYDASGILYGENGDYVAGTASIKDKIDVVYQVTKTEDDH